MGKKKGAAGKKKGGGNGVAEVEVADADAAIASSSGPSKWMLPPETQESAAHSIHALYQRAVQTPRGEISYLNKFFLTYVGGRVPLHLREDFCGTSLICAEWLQGDARRTALGLDIDRGAMLWGLRNNFAKLPDRAKGRLLLLEGNVLDPITAAKKVSLPTTSVETTPTATEVALTTPPETDAVEAPMSRSQLADITCAFNFSTCCLHSRKQLLHYFRRAYNGLNPQGGVFVADLYGGYNSDVPLKLRRDFGDFVYIWEQEGFDAVTRISRIHLSFQIKGGSIKRKAFNYVWRLWTIPDIRECLLEAGFEATHVWMRESSGPQQRSAEERGHDSGDDGDDDDNQEGLNEFEEVESFAQCDSWNAYVVGVRTAVQTER